MTEAIQVRGRILIVKFGAIGDVMMVVPAARTLHDAGYDVHWLCGAAAAPLLALYPWVRTVVADDRAILKGAWHARLRALASVWRKLWPERFDLCATLYYDRRYRLATLPVRCRHRLTLSWTDRDRMMLPGRHHSAEYARLLQQALGLSADGEKPGSVAPLPALPAADATRRPDDVWRIALCPGGARNMLRDNPLRRWPLERYVELARRLRGLGHAVTLIGGPDDRWVLDAFDGVEVENRVGNLPLTGTVDLLDRCDVLVTHDTGPLHLAGGTRAGIVSIFGPTDPGAFLPRRDDVIAFWGGADMACRPCYDGRDFAACTHNGCVRQVDVQTIVEAVESMVERRRQGRHQPFRILPAARGGVWAA